MSDSDPRDPGKRKKPARDDRGKLIPIGAPRNHSEFLRRVASGNQVAVEEFLLGLSGRLRGYLRLRFGKRLGDARARDEIVLRAVRHAALNCSEAPPPGAAGGLEFWLWRIGVDEAWGTLRARGDAQPEGGTEPVAPVAAEALQQFCDSPEDAAADPRDSWTDSTQLLVEALKRGDPDAWTHLDQTYRTAFQAFIGRRMPNALRRRMGPEDVLQSAMLRAASNIDRFEYRGKGSLRAWLAEIIYNRLRDKIKDSHALRCDQQREEEVPTEHLEREGARSEDMELALRLADVTLALQELPAEDRKILILLIHERKNTAEIAKELGIAERSARRRRADALEKLMLLMRE